MLEGVCAYTGRVCVHILEGVCVFWGMVCVTVHHRGQNIWRRAMGLQPADTPLLDAAPTTTDDLTEPSLRHTARRRDPPPRAPSPPRASPPPRAASAGPRRPSPPCPISPALFPPGAAAAAARAAADAAGGGGRQGQVEGFARWRDGEDDELEEDLDLGDMDAARIAARKCAAAAERRRTPPHAAACRCAPCLRREGMGGCGRASLTVVGPGDACLASKDFSAAARALPCSLSRALSPLPPSLLHPLPCPFP
jgi:hypothetical protein